MCLVKHQKEELLQFLEGEMQNTENQMSQALREMAQVKEMEEEDREQFMRECQERHARAEIRHNSLDQTHSAVILGYFNGDCEECGLEIPFDRFKANPAARRCTGCKTEEEVTKKRKHQLHPGTERIVRAMQQ